MSQDFKIQQNVKVGNDLDAFESWADAGRVVPEEAQEALTTAGIRFIDQPGVSTGDGETDYLTLEAFNWFVINALENAGYRIVEK